MSRPQIGELINGKYRLVRLIGEGGMGSVFEARHEYLGTLVALKFLDTELAQRPGLVARFLQEARVSACIRSPHVTQVADVDQTSVGLPYMVMELLLGESLQHELERIVRYPLGIALDYAVQILNGLEVAHSTGVVHRDLKPDNAFVVPTPQGPLIKLLDFGIAKLRVSEGVPSKLTGPNVLMGTPEYMAPEQAFSAVNADQRSDLYAVGVMLFEMVAGRRPVLGDDARAIASAVLTGRVPNLDELVPEVPSGLSAAVRRAMAPKPAERFANAAEMRASLIPFCSTLSPNAAGPGLVHRFVHGSSSVQ